ncbi:MAG TPA: hypothetical protein VE863_21315, partial [Pyrinomonadaceae bacterium]|nr:hypothetical protein [Pyrinomonadaceae bacterium]
MLRGLHFLSRLRVNRCTAIFVCLAVIIVTLVSPVSFARRPQGQGQAQAANGNARKVKPLPPEKGAPKLALPNLDEIRTQRENNPQIKPPVPSTVRARRKQLPSS